MKAHRGIFLECSVRRVQSLYLYRLAAVVGIAARESRMRGDRT
jgi:hypothetical protein